MTAPGVSEPEDPAPPVEALAVEEVHRRAIQGAAVIGLRGAAIRVLSLGANIVLARLLTPRDFGVVAIGTTFVIAATTVADAGLGAGLVRRREPPRRDELQCLLGIQLVASIVLAAAVAVAAQPFGTAGIVTALMMTSVPFTAFRAAPVVVFEYGLKYRPIAVADLAETVAFHAWAISTVAAGWGVWGLASAAPIRAAVGAAVLLRLAPTRVLRPRLAWRRIQPLLSFGVRYQGKELVNLARDQALNLGTAALAGTATLGLWSLALRVLQVPFLVFEALWRVSYPAMARLVAAERPPGPTVERAIGAVAVGSAGLLAVLAASAPAVIPAVFGARWSAAADVIPWASLGLAFSGPVSVATAGYLYAVGQAGAVLRAVVLYALTWLAVALALLPALGVGALGVGWLAAAAVEATVLGRATRRLAGTAIVRPLAVPVGTAVTAGAAGWLLASAVGTTLVGAVAGAALAATIYAGGLALLGRAQVAAVWSLASGALRRRDESQE